MLSEHVCIDAGQRYDGLAAETVSSLSSGWGIPNKSTPAENIGVDVGLAVKVEAEMARQYMLWVSELAAVNNVPKL